MAINQAFVGDNHKWDGYIRTLAHAQSRLPLTHWLRMQGWRECRSTLRAKYDRRLSNN